MMKATEWWVEFNHGSEIKTGFKSYEEAERWSHENTIDGKVIALYPQGDF